MILGHKILVYRLLVANKHGCTGSNHSPPDINPNGGSMVVFQTFWCCLHASKGPNVDNQARRKSLALLAEWLNGNNGCGGVGAIVSETCQAPGTGVD